jgi:hypothetical protein
MTDHFKPNIYFMHRHILHTECVALIHANLVTRAICFPIGNINWLVFITEIECFLHGTAYLQL